MGVTQVKGTLQTKATVHAKALEMERLKNAAVAEQGRGGEEEEHWEAIGASTQALRVLLSILAFILRSKTSHRWVLSRRGDMIRTLKRAKPVRQYLHSRAEETERSERKWKG